MTTAWGKGAAAGAGGRRAAASAQRIIAGGHRVGSALVTGESAPSAGTSDVGPATSPESCSLSLIAPETQVDVTVPASVPVAALIPELVELTSAHRRTIAAPHAHDEDGAVWVLAPVGAAPLSPESTLAEQGIVDGTLLHLQRSAAAAPEPLFDDVVDAVSVAGAERFAQWGAPAARRLAFAVAVTAASAGAWMLLAPSLPDLPLLPRTAWTSGTPGTAQGARTAVAAVCAVLAAIASPVVARVYGDAGTGRVLGYCALPFAFVAGALLPQPLVGPAGLLAGCAFAAACAVACSRAERSGILVHTATTTACLTVGSASALAAFTHPGAQATGAGLLVAAVVVPALAPRLTVLLVRLPMPPVPSRDVRADLAADSCAPARLAPHLVEGTVNAGRCLAGIMAGAAATAAAGALSVTLSPAPLSWPGTVLAAVVCTVLMLRGRGHADTAPAAILVSGGAVTAILTTAAAVGSSGSPHGPAVVTGAVLAATAVAVALYCGVAAQRIGFSPVVRRGVELAEYALIASVLPLALWVMGAYSAMRSL
ncbi:type VII secretion integral membrane protein EccD [Tomitella fengzijianii]|uniref:type VII secretion integral membrane protein EccD n=1 Tax=Tomitella fengzijianii TaxID=2597660 RepID=UPI00131E2369|nr:type VII secretion integral membrane protein EccD [Tomitella fengzijianii]